VNRVDVEMVLLPYNCKADFSGYAFLCHAEYQTACVLGSSF